MKLFVSTPVHGHEVTSLYLAFCIELEQECRKRGVPLTIKPQFGSSNLIKSRNASVHLFLKTDCTHYITFDSDQYASADTVFKLVESKFELTAAPVPKKRENLPAGEMFNFVCEEGVEQVIDGQFLRVVMCGTGLLCAKRSALLRMAYAYPYFMLEGEPVPQLFAEDWTEQDPLYPELLSEDFTFCWRARKIGIPTWVLIDPTVKVKHMGEKVFEQVLHM